MPNDIGCTKRDGKRFLFETGIICNFVSLILIFVAFVSPYWIVSWPRVFSGFKRLGLWEVCFAGMVLETDPDQKSYHGCWWNLAPEFYNVRSWLMPSWFIWTQVAVTVCFVAEAVSFVLMFVCWFTTGRTQRNLKKKKRDSLKLVTTGMIITVATAITMSVTCLVFAVMFKVDRGWLPNPYFNYLSWSYGLAICSTFFSIFGSIALVTFVLIIRQELREPQRDRIDLSGYMPATASSTSNLPRLYPGSKPHASNPALSHASSNPKMSHGSSNPKLNQSYPKLNSSNPNLSRDYRDNSREYKR